MYVIFCLALMAISVGIFIYAPHIGAANDSIVGGSPGPVQQFYRTMSGGRSWSSGFWVAFYRVASAVLFVVMGVLALRSRT